MERKKLLAYGALFAILLMVGSGVLVGFSYLIAGENQGSSTGTVKELSLSAYKNQSLNMNFNSISDVMNLLPQGTVYAQYAKSPNNVPDVFNNTTGIDSVLMGYMYYYMPDENGSYSISSDVLYMYKATDIDAAKVKGAYLGNAGNYTILMLENGSYMIPGTPTIVGSPNAVMSALSIMTGSSTPDTTFSTIASHITTKDADYEYISQAGQSAGYEQYYESGATTSDGKYVMTLHFLNMDKELRDQLKEATESATGNVTYNFSESSDGVLSIIATSPDKDSANEGSDLIGGIIQAYSAAQTTIEVDADALAAGANETADANGTADTVSKGVA